VTHQRGKRKLALMRAQKLESHFQMARLARPRAENLELFARNYMRVEGHRARVAVVAQHEIFPAIAAHLHAFGDSARVADALQYNIRARYEWSVGGYQSFVQAGVSHTAHSYTQAGANPTLAQAGLTTSRLRFELEPYTLVEASVALRKAT